MLMHQTTFLPFCHENKSNIRPLSEEVLCLIKQKKIKEVFDLGKFVQDSKHVKRILSAFNYNFKNLTLLTEALSHASFCHELGFLFLKNNEKLEYLGDSVLSTIVSTVLLDKYPDLKEGELSKLRSALVNEISLAELARFIGLGYSVLLGKGEVLNYGHKRETLLADSFEALVGAIYLDGDFNTVYDSVIFLFAQYDKYNQCNFLSLEKLKSFDAKTKLQEITVSRFRSLPEYRWIQLENHLFKVDLYLNDRHMGTSIGISKKKAERELAQKVLENILQNDDKGINPC